MSIDPYFDYDAEAEEERVTKRSPVTVSGQFKLAKLGLEEEMAGLSRKLNVRNVVWLVSLCAGVIAFSFTAYGQIDAKNKERVDAGIEPLKQRVSTNEQETRALRDDVHELARDIREIYRVMPKARRSERLEKEPQEDAGK
jgi:septal ring factor EnvC (AmiA/AmiB activator)